MVDITSATAALTSLKTALDLANLIKESSTGLKEAEIQLKITNLISEIVEAKTQIHTIKSELLDKQDEIASLKKQLEFKDSLQYEAPYYWRVSGDGDKDGPYCQHCWDSEKSSKPIRLQSLGNGLWNCQNCSNTVRDSSYRSPGPIMSGRVVL